MDKSTSTKNGKCLSCGNKLLINNNKLFDTRFGIDFVYSRGYCLLCGLEQIFPVPSPAELKKLYETYYNFGGENETAYTRIREQFLSHPLYRLWLTFDGDISFHNIRGSGRLLDVGCNEGRGLGIYKSNGFDVEGLELNEKAAAKARKRGFRVHTTLLEEFRPGQNYDTVVFSNVLEHSLHPREMLRHASRILNPGGQLWISCPNVESWQRRLFGKNWINWHVPFHITHFSGRTLAGILEKAGFEIAGFRQESPALWTAHSLIALIFARRGKATRQLRNPLLVASLIMVFRGLFFPFSWLGNRLGRGDCMVVIAEKR
jgi:2-polyprenyl-3-methyl-5-hydroxy-6-metoxy-1,4-benzoquinol methylase